MILMIHKKKGKRRDVSFKYLPEILHSKRKGGEKNKSSPYEAFLLTSHFAYLFIYHICSPATCTAGGARDHRCWGESDGHPQFIIHTPVTAGQAEIWHGKHEP